MIHIAEYLFFRIHLHLWFSNSRSNYHRTGRCTSALKMNFRISGLPSRYLHISSVSPSKEIIFLLLLLSSSYHNFPSGQNMPSPCFSQHIRPIVVIKFAISVCFVRGWWLLIFLDGACQTGG